MPLSLFLSIISIFKIKREISNYLNKRIIER